MKTLYKHVHLVIDDKREYLDGSILINDGIIEDVFVQSNKTIEDAKELDMNGKIFIPMFFDTKSKLEKQKGVINRFVCSEKVLEEPTHLVSDESIKTLKNVCAVTRINNYQKVNKAKPKYTKIQKHEQPLYEYEEQTKALNFKSNEKEEQKYVIYNKFKRNKRRKNIGFSWKYNNFTFVRKDSCT